MVPAPAWVPFKTLVGTYPPKGTIPALVETLFLRWDTGDALKQSLSRATFLELLLQLLSVDARAESRNDFASKIAYRTKAILDQQEQNGSAGIISLLESTGYSYHHVCRIFRKSFGLSPLSYLNARRLERAKLLLNDPRLTVSEVAYQSGFQDPGYFIRIFRRQTGMTPGRYRQQIR